MALVNLPPPNYPCATQMACFIRKVGATANRTIHIALFGSLAHTEERLAIHCHYLQERYTMGIMLNLTHNSITTWFTCAVTIVDAMPR